MSQNVVLLPVCCGDGRVGRRLGGRVGRRIGRRVGGRLRRGIGSRRVGRRAGDGARTNHAVLFLRLRAALIAAMLGQGNSGAEARLVT